MTYHLRKLVKHLFWTFALSVFLASCAGPKEKKRTHIIVSNDNPVKVNKSIQGRLCGTTYYDPHGTFQFEFPVEYQAGGAVEEQITKHTSSIGFHNSLGKYIEVSDLDGYSLGVQFRLPNEEELKKLSTLISRGEEKQCPHQEIIHESFHQIEGVGLAYFKVLRKPSGGTLFDVATNRMYDSIRAALLFIRSNFQNSTKILA